FLMTLALTWVVWIPRAMGFPVGVVGRLWTWIPAITALVCAALLYGRPGVGDLGRRLVRWRVRWWWYPVVLVGPLVLSLIAAGLAVLLGEPWTAVRPAALRLSIPALVLTFLILMISDGLGEELGWRGYLLPRLLRRYRAIPASVILGFGWWLWHLPLVWTAGAAMEGQPLWLLLADLMAKSLIFTYVFLGTQGSVLFAIMLHASTNLFAVSPTVGPDGDMTLPLVALVLKVVLAAALFVHLPRSLSEARNSGSVIFSDSEVPR
ncbi:MAG TPA: CPBP family intramembrane glutamic endopeptidase, partial [Propionibacteriaceae bacterium]|nr:CPBP family intramembrane glutamic endopeptidase [Propionibacteriaceae bacterium]